jgi:hypothetical protein
VTEEPDAYICTGLAVGDLSPDEPLWILRFSAILEGKRWQ